MATETPKFWMSCRFKFGLISFIANILSYLHRVNMNMAIVCMLGTSRQAIHLTPSNISMNNRTADFQDNNGILKQQLTHVNQSLLGVLDVTKTTGKFSENNNAGTVSSQLFTEGKTNNPDGNVTLRENEMALGSEFNWDKAEISMILSSFYYGSIVTQIPAGYFAHRFGGKHVISVFLVISGVSSLLAPIAANTSTTLIVLVRIILGTAGGMFTPAVYALTMNWTKPSQRAALLSVTISGQPLGIVIAYLTSGFLCALGWSTIFYVHGALTFLVLLLWLYEIHSTPAEHPRISQAELKYLTSHLNRNIQKAVPPTPWKSILLSRPQWATILAHFAFNWSYYTLVINVPLFLKEAFAYVITENGVYSALPYVFCTVSLMFSGKLSAMVVKRKFLTLQATRKLFNGISLGGIAVCVMGAGQVTYEFRFVAVILISFSCIFVGVTFGGAIPAYADIAGIFTGPAFSVGNAIGVIAVIVSALTAGWLTPNGHRHEWQNVFYVAAGINLFSIIVFSIFGEATLQRWAIVEGYNSSREIAVELEDDLLGARKEKEFLENGHLEILNTDDEND